MTKRDAILTAAALPLAFTLLAACGGSDTDGASDTPPPAAETSQPTVPAPTDPASTQPPSTDSASTAPALTSASTTTTEAVEPVRVLVTNDDGVSAEGIDMIVQALLEQPNFEVTVVAPATEQSGQGGNITDGPLTATDATTASGYPATAVAGFPADTMIWALDQGGIDFVPDLVVSGANKGQNLGPVIDASGTVGAARAAAVRSVPAIAVSAGFGDAVDFASATAALISYLDENLDQIVAHEQGAPVTEVISINAPTCSQGEIRGTVVVPLGVDLQDFDYGVAVDCTSTFENPLDDVEAFFNGFIAVSPTPLQPATG